MKRITWSYPIKSREKSEKRLEEDMREPGFELDRRNPQIIKKIHKDGSIWFHTEVDDF